MRRRDPHVPDLTPLIDVVFILLIFFIVSSVFKKEELALILNLPSSEAEALEIDKKEITIELSKDKLAIKGEETTIKELEIQLQKVENKTRAIIMRIDEEVMYKRVVKILDLLQKYELNNLAMVTKRSQL
jgi:biopolymer transport protein ExbD